MSDTLVFTPAWNEEANLPAVLEELAGVLPGADVLVVDDGSTDGTAELAERYADAVTLVRQENRGAPAAYNRAFRSLRCEYVAMCPADDLWEPRKLEWQADAVAAHPEVDIAFGRARFFGLREADYPAPPGTGVLDPDALRAALYEENVLAAPTALVRRELHDRLGGFREDIAIEDYEFWLRALGEGAVFFYDPRLLARLRWHGENLSSQALTVWELSYEIHRRHADVARDDELVRDVLARDLRAIARCRLGLGRVREARAAYRASLRHRPSAVGALASAALGLPGAERAVRYANARRRRRP